MRKYWLITTDHLEDRLLFKDAEDFRVGMNYVAIWSFKTGVFVLSFILMSNHLHFVLSGTKEQVESFINGFKSAFSRYLWDKYGVRETLRRNSVDISEIKMGNEALERAIAYVQMNCVAANICAWPTDYPWGTGNCFFNDSPGFSSSSHGQALSSLKERARYRLLHSKVALPGEWIISEGGYIAPESYIKKDWVESLYRTPKRMNYFLQSSSKARLRLEAAEENQPSFRDQVILSVLPDLCQSLFRKRSVEDLEEEQLVELMRQLRFRFSTNVNQIARVTGISYEHAAKLLDRV